MQAAKPDDWHFLVGLNGWAPSISGTLTIRGNVQIPYDVSISDLLHHLKMIVPLGFQAQKGDFGGNVNVFYAKVGGTPLQAGLPAEPINASVDVRQMILEGFGFWRLAHGDAGNPWSIELIGGVRYWDTNARIETDVTDTSGKTIDWADGFGGLRVEMPLTSSISILGRGDMGAGGAKRDWSASGDLALRLGKGWVGGAGYRTVQVDFDKSDVLGTRRVFDMAYSGPRMWIVYTW